MFFINIFDESHKILLMSFFSEFILNILEFKMIQYPKIYDLTKE